MGLYSGAFATYKPGDANNFATGAYPQLCWLGGQECAYPNADADADLGGTGVVTASAGVVTMQPVIPNKVELAAIAATATANVSNGFPKANTIEYLAGALNTFPYCLKPPLAFGFWITLPSDMNKGGRWPAGWLLAAPPLGWPPEIDILEAIEQGTAIELTSSNHDNAITGASITDIWGPGSPGQSMAMMGVVYPDLIATFQNGKCVATFPTQSDEASALWYLILNDGIGAPGSWAGAPPAGASLEPTVFSNITAYAMPTLYPGASVPTPAPVPTPTPTPPAGARALINQAQTLLAQALTLVP
jgi:hypothetical protein